MSVQQTQGNGYATATWPSHAGGRRRRWPLFCSGRKRLIAIAAALCLSCVCLYYVTTHGGGADDDFDHDCWSPLRDSFGRLLSQADAGGERARIRDLERLRQSLLDDIRRMQDTRDSLRRSIEEMQHKAADVNRVVEEKGFELLHAERLLSQAKASRSAALDSRRPELSLPLNVARRPLAAGSVLLPGQTAEGDSGGALAPCTIDTCINMSKCAVAHGSMAVFVRTHGNVDAAIHIAVVATIGRHWRISHSASTACLHVVLTHSLETYLLSTSHIDNDQRTNQLIVLTSNNAVQFLPNLRAIVAAPVFYPNCFRPHYDIIIPDLTVVSTTHTVDDVWATLKPILPLKRTYFASYTGSYATSGDSDVDNFAQSIVDTTHAMGAPNATGDGFLVDFTCHSRNELGEKGVFAQCDDAYEERVLSSSVFALVLPHARCFTGRPQSNCHASSVSHNGRMLMALRSGAIPVLLGVDQASVALGECGIDVASFTVRIPLARLTELHFILRSVTPAAAVEMRRKGRAVYERYMATVDGGTNALLACVSSRLLLPPKAIEAVQSAYLLGSAQETPQRTALISVDPLINADVLGPYDGAVPSLAFQHNFTNMVHNAHTLWNTVYWPHVTPRSLPTGLGGDPPMPTGARLGHDTAEGFRPINNGRGGSGAHFREDLGGNEPLEQFTIVLLTYERDATLNDTIAHLNHLPYLHKVIVVWNCDGAAACGQVARGAADSLWPQLHVPLVFATVNGTNSLNNRFAPLADIETDAVLSLDDDVHLTHEEVVFAFRVWREHRDRVVGLPARFHAWENGQWLYDSNHTCELSMVLTGAAFVHTYYLYAYTHWMPSAIRAKVDELMNCEDVAMNFLVSHLTRKPPVKVTSKWTFTYEGQPAALSSDESHFVERHDCVRFFTTVYGYNPLLYTQYRADSVLFKTRLPTRHEKCFRNV